MNNVPFWSLMVIAHVWYASDKPWGNYFGIVACIGAGLVFVCAVWAEWRRSK